MNEIGGYFGLELKTGKHYHSDAIRLNTARSCFEYIVITKKYKKVFIPYYTCDVLLEPLEKLNVAYSFYHIDEQLEPTKELTLRANEAFLYTNYFGIKQDAVKRLAQYYGDQLIIDNAQAFYVEALKGIDTFYSARKFFGVSDGAYLYTDMELANIEQDYSYGRMSHLLKRIDLSASEGYADFHKNDKMLEHQPILRMSKLTEGLLANIDYESVRKQRTANYKYLESALQTKNKLQLKLGKNDVPMVYSYYTNDRTLRKKLIKNRIFVPTYWSNVKEWADAESQDFRLTENLLPLPIDQRYGKEEMDYIIQIINDNEA